MSDASLRRIVRQENVQRDLELRQVPQLFTFIIHEIMIHGF